MEEPKDELIEILKNAGYETFEFLPGETLAQALKRIRLENL